MGEREKILDYIESELTEPIRDPIWKHIYCAPAHEAVISLPVFQELHAIKQLGPAYLVYPGATHTRFAHSLGTFHIAQRIIHHLVRRSPRTVFTLGGVKAFLCAALLHDVGHYPFAHACKHLGLAAHETLTGRLIREQPLADVLKLEAGADPERTAAIVDAGIDASGDDEVTRLRRLLSGVLDPDKLDYLNRDAYYCGVPYGVQDVDFFLGEIAADPDAGFTLTAKGLTAVEHILFSKYLMYKTVYWHKTVRTATAMIKKALLLTLRDNRLAPDDLYRLTDTTFESLFARRRSPAGELAGDVFARRFYRRIASVPFDAANPGHRRLEDPQACLQRETDLAAALGGGAEEADVVIDIPESLRFEIDLPVAPEPGAEGGGRAGGDGAALTIWSGQTPESFSRTLRTVSLLVRREEKLERAADALCREGDPFHP